MTAIWTFDPEQASKRLRSLIKKEANSGELELDKQSVLDLKDICKTFGEPLIKQAYQQCITYLSKQHSQVRVAALNMIDFFFQRAHNFRSLLLEDLDSFLMLTIEVTQSEKEKRPLPPPKQYAQILKERTVKIINAWHADYGEGYEKLRYAYKYLREHKLVDFSQLRVLSREAQLREAERRSKQERLLQKAIRARSAELDEISPDIERLVAQIESLLEIIIPSVESSALIPDAEDRHEECRAVDNDETKELDRRLREMINQGQQLEIEISPYVSIIRNKENDTIITTLKDLRRELVDNKLPRLKRIMQIMSKKTELCTDQIRRSIDLKSKVMNSIIRMSELKIVTDMDSPQKANKSATTLDNESDSSDGDFEEVPEKEDLELYIPKSLRSEYGIDDNPSRENYDECVPSTSGTQVDHQEKCSAPLPNGKLCPRRDKVKCPFHGKIIPRDQFGKPTREEDRIREESLTKANSVPDWQDPGLLRDIQATIGIDLTMPGIKKQSTKKKKSKLVNARTHDVTPQQRLQIRMKKMGT